MRIISVDNYDEMSKKAASMVASQMILKHDSVLGLATGETPTGMYKELIKLYDDEECLDYDEKIKASGGIDIQVLGMGT